MNSTIQGQYQQKKLVFCGKRRKFNIFSFSGHRNKINRIQMPCLDHKLETIFTALYNGLRDRAVPYPRGEHLKGA